MKPFKGTIRGTRRTIPGVEYLYSKNLGYIIVGYFQDHPQFGPSPGHTSLIVKKGRWKDDKCKVETLNSRYIWERVTYQ